LVLMGVQVVKVLLAGWGVVVPVRIGSAVGFLPGQAYSKNYSIDYGSTVPPVQNGSVTFPP